jgi:hypothetical protein
VTGQEVGRGGGDIDDRTENQIFFKQQEGLTWELGRSGSHNSWWRSMGATIGLIETTCEELLKLWILTNLNIRILFKIWKCGDNKGHWLSLHEFFSQKGHSNCISHPNLLINNSQN